MNIKKLAAQYVSDQIKVMQKYGGAPKLTAEKRKEFQTAVERTFMKMQKLQHAK